MTKISLCMIVGNVEEYIHRCLTSFAPISDEWCIVRAIGNRPPDRTEEMIRELAALHNIPLRFAEYKNKPGHEDWPHVDDFAAARQMSFDLATGDYCFWCDSDDTLESGAEHVRELAERGGYACFMFPYRIMGQDLMVPRERMMLKASGRWHYPVHECFLFKVAPVMAAEDERVVVVHMPSHRKTGSNDRNLRIMRSIPESDRTPGLLYHLATELAIENNIEECVRVAEQAITHPEIGKPERYDLLLMLTMLTQDPEKVEAFLHEAYKTDPCRREALYLLANNALNYGQNANALAYGRQMMATRAPEKTAWNHRVKCYGWAGAEMWQQCLRANGLFAEAEKSRVEEIQKAGGPRIALIHATRGRARQASIARKQWLSTAHRPEQIEHIFVFDEDDVQSAPLMRMHHLILPPGGGCVAAWNAGVFATGAPVIIQMSDDWIPPLKWDEMILERLGDVSRPSVLAVSDGVRKDDLLCMAICTRAYVEQDCFLFHPWFTGVYSDNWFTKMAYERKAVIEARDMVFEHLHPIAGKAEVDETYARQNSSENYERGRAMMERLELRRDWSTVHGWFNYWQFYQQMIRHHLKDGDIAVEVGVWKGRSLIFLAQECERLGKSVDIHGVEDLSGENGQEATGEELKRQLLANIRHCQAAVTMRFKSSREAAADFADGTVAFCFIDASHDYEQVKADIATWRLKMKPGGILAGHDADHEPVRRAVLEAYPNAMLSGTVWIAK